MDAGKSHEVRSLLGPTRTIRIRHRRFGLWGRSPAALGSLLLLWALLSGAAFAGLTYFEGPADYYVAVDDGRSTRVTALAVPAALYQQLVEGATVRVKTTAWLGHVLSIKTVEPAARANPAPPFPHGEGDLGLPAHK